MSEWIPLKTRPMDEDEREEMLDYFRQNNEIYNMCIEALSQPERERGRWIKNDNGTYSCSLCQSWIPNEQHYYARYCLHCGAEMGEPE